MPAKRSIEDIDLDSLSEGDQTKLRPFFGKTNLCLRVVCYIAVVNLIALYHAFRAETAGGFAIQFVVFKLAAYFALAIWARSWSKPAPLLLLAWHLLVTFTIWNADGWATKAMVWIPALLFLFAAMGANGRSSLIEQLFQKSAATKIRKTTSGLLAPAPEIKRTS